MPIAVFHDAAELIRSDKLGGPTDLYRALLTVKNGFGNGVTRLGQYSITKAEARRAGIDWPFVVNSVEVLGLKIENRVGRHGHSISK